jgi:penicillin-binding protein 1C
MKTPIRSFARRYRWPLAAGVVVFGPPLLLFFFSLFVTLPGPLQKGAARAPSTRYLDRNGVLLREVRADDGVRAEHSSLAELGTWLPLAVVAAEDKRFRDHPGVDVVAVARAAFSDLVRRRIVSGASTLTMQLARVERPHKRRFAGKWMEMAYALKIERALSKDEILEAYLNDAPFGPNVAGASRAARLYFDKPARELTAAEAATLAAMPRGPAFYDLTKHPERVLARRDVILHRMQDAGMLDGDTCAAALAEPLTPTFTKGGFGAPHAIEFLRFSLAAPTPSSAAIALGIPGSAPRRAEVRTTLDAVIQREAEQATARVVERLGDKNVGSAAVLVIENQTGNILAWVGSPDWNDDSALGKNDGVLAARQPGSTLKPFVYALGMEMLRQTPATLLMDVETTFPSANGGRFSPNNYDGRFHGPVRLREALANSWNVPAAREAHDVGVPAVVDQLKKLGFTTFTEAPEFYGEGIALGDGETRLYELARAYAVLARGGRAVSLKLLSGPPDDAPHPIVLPLAVVQNLENVLQDADARRAAFGNNRDLADFPFPVAVKTGTSKGYRDNLTVGWSDRVTVAVWVGNFDGAPMAGTTGVSGAAPLFHSVILAAHGRVAPPALPVAAAEEAPDDDVELCALSGELASRDCPHRIHEKIPKDRRPTHLCTMHVMAYVDKRNGLRAGPSCSPDVLERKLFERYPAEASRWAERAGRPLLPEGESPFCPGAPELPRSPLAIVSPRDGARYLLDADRPAALQRVPLRIEGASRRDVFLDGKRVTSEDLPMTVGNHLLRVESDQGAEEVQFSVR